MLVDLVFVPGYPQSNPSIKNRPVGTTKIYRAFLSSGHESVANWKFMGNFCSF